MATTTTDFIRDALDIDALLAQSSGQVTAIMELFTVSERAERAAKKALDDFALAFSYGYVYDTGPDGKLLSTNKETRETELGFKMANDPHYTALYTAWEEAADALRTGRMTLDAALQTYRTVRLSQELHREIVRALAS